MEQSQIERERATFLAHDQHSLGLPSLFYGSLRAPEVFELIIGRPMADVPCEPVVLHRHELARIIAGDDFPGIFPTEDNVDLHCLLVPGLTYEEQLRVAWYEWDEYKLSRFETTDGRQAQAFVPDVDAIHRLHGAIDFKPWSFEEWRERNLSAAIPNARIWMSKMPDISAKLCAAE
ncbi:MAG: hypothetical protein RLW87_11770 [Alphaproteobacteria bacterium]